MAGVIGTDHSEDRQLRYIQYVQYAVEVFGETRIRFQSNGGAGGVY